jgi:hypothetical protein
VCDCLFGGEKGISSWATNINTREQSPQACYTSRLGSVLELVCFPLWASLPAFWLVDVSDSSAPPIEPDYLSSTQVFEMCL